jgi:protein required for attachment to host cells
MRIWIVVADEYQALFYETGGGAQPAGLGEDGRDDAGARRADSACRLALKITNPQAGSDYEPASDRTGGELRGSTAQPHGAERESGAPHRDEEAFAQRIADEIERARHAGTFERLVLAAGPRMLGLIRVALSDASRSAVAAEVAKDLVRLADHALLAHLPPEALPRPSARA